MYFAHDETNNFYYYGVLKPYPRIYQEHLVENQPRLIGFDVETISLKERIAIGIGIATAPDMCFYFPLFPTESPVVPWHLLKDPDIVKVAHNAMFDLGCLDEYEIDDTNIADTNVMSRLLCNKFNGLLDLSHVHGMEVHEVKELLAAHGAKIMLELPEEVVARKCMQDSAACLKLYYEFVPQTDMAYFQTEMETYPIMLKMASRGLLIDHRIRMALEIQLDEDVELYLKMCNEAEAFNPASPQQVGYILAKRGAYDVFPRLPFTRNKYGKKTSTLSTAKEILEKMDDPLANLILLYKKKSKLLSTYIKPWAEDTRAYTRFHLDAATGRPSSTDRNMQNIPGIKSLGGVNVRAMFLPDTGIWTDMDFSQVELRVIAYLSQDKEMLHVYEIEGDIHQLVADFMDIDRSVAKNVDFAMIYGGTDQCIAETAHIRSKDRAKQLKEMWFAKFPQAGDWIRSVQEEGLRTGKARTVFGRNLRLPSDDEEGKDAIERKAVNYPIQGSAAEILKRALIQCKDMDIALQVHDELLIDGLIPADRFKSLEYIAPFRTPIEVKYLERWE